MDAPPDRIELRDVGAVLRRYDPDDLDPLHAAIEESRDHLRAFMPWADQARADTATFLASTTDQWRAGSDCHFVIADADDASVLGGCGLHCRAGPDAREIGYWLRVAATGRGIATAAAGALTDAALAMRGIERVEIHCDEANVRSAAVARRLGYRLARIEPDRVSAPGELGRSMIWVRSRAQPAAGDHRPAGER